MYLLVCRGPYETYATAGQHSHEPWKPPVDIFYVVAAFSAVV